MKRNKNRNIPLKLNNHILDDTIDFGSTCSTNAQPNNFN